MTLHHPREEDALRVEPDEVPRRPLVIIAVVAAIIAVAGVFVARALLVAATPSPSSSPAPAVAAPEIGIVEQTLLPSTRRGLDEKAAQRKSLERFVWVDRRRGIAEIPIEDAMDLVADPAFLQKVEQATERTRARAPEAGP